MDNGRSYEIATPTFLFHRNKADIVADPRGPDDWIMIAYKMVPQGSKRDRRIKKDDGVTNERQTNQNPGQVPGEKRK